MDEQYVLLVTEKSAARLYAVSTAALRRWRREGRGPRWVRVGKCVRYRVRDLEQFLDANSREGEGDMNGPR